MRFAFVALAVILGVATSVPLLSPKDLILQDLQRAEIGVRNDALEQMILDLLDILRDIMLTGVGDIPVLDPFTWDYLHLDQALLDDFGILELLGLDINLDNSYLTVSNVSAVGASTFVIDNLSLRMTSFIPMRYTLEVDAYIPALEAGAGMYDIQLSALGFNIFGNGDAKFTLVEPRLKVTIVVTPSILGGITISVTSTRIAIELKGFESKITGLFHDSGASDFVNLLLEGLIPDLVQFYESELTAAISPVVQDIANSILQDLNIGDLLPLNEIQYVKTDSLKY